MHEAQRVLGHSEYHSNEPRHVSCTKTFKVYCRFHWTVDNSGGYAVLASTCWGYTRFIPLQCRRQTQHTGSQHVGKLLQHTESLVGLVRKLRSLERARVVSQNSIAQRHGHLQLHCPHTQVYCLLAQCHAAVIRTSVLGRLAVFPVTREVGELLEAQAWEDSAQSVVDALLTLRGVFWLSAHPWRNTNCTVTAMGIR